jgi:predicted HAD superfamily Cof-like phosphohydrolase
MNVPFVDEVEEFNATFGKLNNYEPTIPSRRVTDFVVNFIREETDELEEAISENDIVGVLDAICDLLYVAVGNATMAFGLKEKLIPAYQEVQASNMSKSCATEQEALDTINARMDKYGPCHYRKVGDRYVVYRSSDDKVMKSINYFPPNLEQFFTQEEIKNARRFS